jgi:capsular exopolysaccharide synthesis family protein
VIPQLSVFMNSQVVTIQTPEMVRRAMDKSVWRDLGRPQTDDEVNRFLNNLDVEEIPGTSLIRITFNDLDQKAAQAGATAICLAYKDYYYDELDPLSINSRLTILESKKAKISNDLQAERAELSNLSKKYGTADLDAYEQEQLTQLNDLRRDEASATREYTEAQAALGVAQGASDDAGKPKGVVGPAMTEAQIALIDPKMAGYLDQRTTIENNIQIMVNKGMLDANPTLKSARLSLDVLNAQIDQYVKTFNENYRTNPGQKPGAPPLAVSLQSDLDAKRVRKDLLNDQIAKQDDYVHEVGVQVQLIDEVKQKIVTAQQDLDSVTKQVESLNSQKSLMTSSMQIAPTEPALDKRKQMTVLGFVGGSLIPLAAILLISLLDGRFRYSDETGHDLGGVPLLGILPNLPDLLTDPEQAATAAHCVHQIRTILQITGFTTDRRVFAVTSGSPGDGKTSLTLALGLSFAASGSKTLLIDCDLVGGGLTARLNVSTDHGVLEAMAARDIMPFIRGTDVADLSILPIGEAMGGYTGTIAPASVRRLVNEARKHFDVIVIDTGPILGSIEASPVAVASDGVILCVSRGQQRQLVDRALSHLQSIGAKLAGVVFNRAQSHDFEKSISRMSMKPLPSPNGHGNPNGRSGAHIGPVAKAVASSVRGGTGADRSETM